MCPPEFLPPPGRAPTPPPRRHWPARLLRWLVSWRTVRRALLTLVASITLIALGLHFENWRGKRAWERFKSDWERRGEKFEFDAFLPEPVPDDENFLAAPFFTRGLQATAARARGAGSDAAPLAPSSPSGLDIFHHGRPGSAARPGFGHHETGELTDLAAWQAFYRSDPDFPAGAPGESPAQTVLIALGKFAPELAELEAASRRPQAVLPRPSYENIGEVLPVLAQLKGIALAARLRATARLAAGQPDLALADVRFGLRVAEALHSAPLLITHLVRLATLAVACDTVWEGLARGRWDEAQLRALQEQLAGLDLLAEYQVVMRAERAFGNAFYGQLRAGRVPGVAAGAHDGQAQGILRWGRLFPAGWLYHNQLATSTLFQEHVFKLVDPGQHRVFVDATRTLDQAPPLKPATLYNVMARLLTPAMDRVPAKTARAQAVLDQATVACALERYRLAEGRLPERLADLVPRFLAQVPPDVIDGQPLRFRRTDDGGYALYSIGWNERDDGGHLRAQTAAGTPRATEDAGDWVWIRHGR